MSKWAAIVYGRTYHLDFRFITVPQDFTAKDLNWASTHIVATTRQARNLAGSPRWSLFKNNSYCVVGVTCTIEDLIGNTVKDDRDRPLYGFFGYVTQLTSDKIIYNLPPYSDRLDDFKILYEEIERVWLIRNYDHNSRKPTLSQYYSLDFVDLAFDRIANPKLNTVDRNPDKVYLWSNHLEQKKLLWQTSAQSSVPIATCLNIEGKPLTNSPFLNQSNHRTEQFQILKRVLSTDNRVNRGKPKTSSPNSTLSQISDRAKEDINLTLQQATKLAVVGQKLISNLAHPNRSIETNIDQDNSIDDPEFGFKKISDSDRDSVGCDASTCGNHLCLGQSTDRDWF